VNQQLHRLALELLVVSFLNLLFLHGFSLFTLSFRVRKFREGSRIKTRFATEISLATSPTYTQRNVSSFINAIRIADNC
jgi:hypothetical protein